MTVFANFFWLLPFHTFEFSVFCGVCLMLRLFVQRGKRKKNGSTEELPL